MPRVRGTEMVTRVSTRGPAPLRTSSSDSDPPRHRSPRIGDRKSPKSVHSDPPNQKKLGTRIAGLETQLEQAQGELKLLKNQLTSIEAAKKEAQKELDKKTINQNSNKEISQQHETLDDNQKETDVFEVPIETVKVKVNVPTESPEKVEKSQVEAINEEMRLLKQKLEALDQENKVLKHELSEANVKITSAVVNEQKLTKKLGQTEQELTKSKTEKSQLKEKLKEVEEAKGALESEMKRVRVQTEQWRKAADAAAAILAGSERCGSMEKQHYGGVFEGFVGLGDELDDGFGEGKRKGSGMRMFGDLWKKKGHK